MKVKTSDASLSIPRFEPFHLELTFETLEEVEAFYRLFNTVPICDYLYSNGGIETRDIRSEINKRGIDPVGNIYKFFKNYIRDHT